MVHKLHQYDPSLLDNMHENEFFQDRAILTPKNVSVDEINDYMLDLIPGEEKIYLSCESGSQSHL